MVQARDSGGLSVLRALSVRLSSVKASQLPHIVASQIQSLKDCRYLLSQPRNTSQNGGDAGVVIHRFYTQLATLVQGRSVEERWAAAVLIKATVEAGGYEALSKCKHWVSGLLTNLRKPDPPSTRALYVTTLTRIFILTWSYPSLVREITTPSLSPFIKTCLGNIGSQNRDEKELRVVLESFTHLLPHHHTTFRSHVKDIESIATQESGLSDSDLAAPGVRTYSTATRLSAARLVTALHGCEPKQGYATSWENAIDGTIEKTQRATDVVLHGVDEDLESAATSTKAYAVKYMNGQSPQNRVVSMHANSERITNGLDALSCYISSDSTGSVAVQIHQLDGLVQRLLGCVYGATAQGPSLRFTPDVGRDERDTGISVLPRIHVSALHLLTSLLDRYGSLLGHLAHTYIAQLRWLFQAEKDYREIRRTCYDVLVKVLSISGPSLSKETVEQISTILRAGCDDVLPPKEAPYTSDGSANGSTSRANGLLKQASKSEQQEPTLTGLKFAASRLLVATYHHVPASLLSDSNRTSLDRTAILAQQKEAIAASVLNPGRKQGSGAASSLLPFLARTTGSGTAIESLLRPRMPVLQSGDVALPMDNINSARSDAIGVPEPDNHGFGVEDCNEHAQIQQELQESMDVTTPEDLSDDYASTTRKRAADEAVTIEAISDKRPRIAPNDGVDESVERPSATESSASFGEAIRAEDEFNETEKPGLPVEAISAETTAAIVAPVPVQQGAITGDANQVSMQDQESDEDDFVIPDLTMDVSEDEEE
ncbi:hypothetical protein B9Z65_6277 [Elsinoe australis]|uniref:Pre-rRNA-processing protein RIX1 n=1 Tax=Elsinoe australis TaxID=40998 RepID=A0A2P8A864_9PEZI|nr:hypothetical protein B9Z65_6277 [Elsinoe australis]